MKNSYKRLIIFDIVILIILALNSFILNILSHYLYMTIFMTVLLVAFKFLFGYEKDHYRYNKDIIMSMMIVLLTSFIIYYIFGIFIGFYQTTNYLNWFGIREFIIPYALTIILREYLRVQMLNKADTSRTLTIVTCLLFIAIELSAKMVSGSFDTGYGVFIFIATYILPVISNNIACTYIAKKVGYKTNVFWLLVVEFYTVFLPIAPNAGLYIGALIKFLYPLVLMYFVYSFFQKRAKDIPVSYIKKRAFIEIPVLAAIVFALAYFVSGYFRYYAIAVATGSMFPNINVGDVVIVDQHRDYKDLEVGEVIAYKYGKVVVVHRLCDIVKIKEDYYFYTKGDNNEDKDNYIIYPDTILGSVSTKIPYIGLPTVWLNKLFE